MSRSDLPKVLDLLEKLSRLGKCLPPEDKDADLLKHLDTYFRGLDGSHCLGSLVPLSLRAIELGASPYTASRFIDWRDFEEVVLNYLLRSGFEGVKSVRLKSRRYEIDVLALEPVSRVGLAIDCKHWSPGYGKRSKLRQVATEHRLKVELLINDCEYLISKYQMLTRAKWIVPVVVTLTDSLRGYFNGSFVVPIQGFRDFINNVEYYLDVLSDFEGRVRNGCAD